MSLSIASICFYLKGGYLVISIKLLSLPINWFITVLNLDIILINPASIGMIIFSQNNHLTY